MFTQLATYNDGFYSFMQKHQVHLQDYDDKSYVQITIMGEGGNKVSTITLHEIADEEQLSDFRDSNNIRNTNLRSSLETSHRHMNQETGRLEIFRLGILLFNFGQRLDPLVYIYKIFKSLFSWKQPWKTFSFGILLTILIYNLKTSILIFGIGLYLGQKYILKKVERIHRYRDNHNRLMVPQQNVVFLQEGMDNYCLLYQNISNILFQDDKSNLISLITLTCKAFALLVVLLYIFGFQHLVVLGIWLIFLMTSPYRTFIFKYIGPIVIKLTGQSNRIIDKLKVGIKSALGSKKQIYQQQTIRQFYFYTYQRWWVLRGWLEQNKKYSDQDYDCILKPKEQAPEGWAWIEEWKIDFSGSVDSEGFQYANDLNKQFKSINSVSTRRRRKWKRSCRRLNNGTPRKNIIN